jgi:hypothetical protein
VEKGKYSSGTPIRNSKDLKNNIAALDDAFSKASLQNDTTVYRGVDNEAWAKIVAQAKTGEVSDAGFMSTTTNKSSVTGSSLTHWMTIQVPKGSKAIPLDGEVKNRTKNEILLDKGSKFKVLKLTKNSCVLELL